MDAQSLTALLVSGYLPLAATITILWRQNQRLRDNAEKNYKEQLRAEKEESDKREEAHKKESEKSRETLKEVAETVAELADVTRALSARIKEPSPLDTPTPTPKRGLPGKKKS